MSNSLRPHGLKHNRPPCPSPTPGVHPNSCPSSQWCHPTISSSVVPFSSCLQSFPASGSFPRGQFFPSGGQSTESSASTSVLPMKIQDWFSLRLTGWISLQSKGRSTVFSNTTVQNIKNYNKRSRQTALRTLGKKEFHQDGKSDASNCPLPTGKPKNVLKEETESRLAEGWAAAIFDALLPPMNSPLFCCGCSLQVLFYLPTAGQKPPLPHCRSSAWISHPPLHHVRQWNLLFQLLSKST